MLHKNAQMREFGELIAPESIRLLGLYVNPLDRQSIVAGDILVGDRYMLLQTSRGSENTSVSDSEVEAMMGGLRSQMDQHISDELQRFKNMADKLEMQMKINRPVPTGFFHQASDATGWTLLTRIETKAEQKTEENSEEKTSRDEGQSDQETEYEDWVASHLVMTVQGKLLFLYIYSRYNGEEDAEWAEKKALLWMQALRKANPASTR